LTDLKIETTPEGKYKLYICAGTFDDMAGVQNHLATSSQPAASPQLHCDDSAIISIANPVVIQALGIEGKTTQE